MAAEPQQSSVRGGECHIKQKRPCRAATPGRKGVCLLPRFNLDLDKGKQPEPGTYFCTKCNRKQVVLYPGQVLKPCPKCGGRDLSTV